MIFTVDNLVARKATVIDGYGRPILHVTRYDTEKREVDVLVLVKKPEGLGAGAIAIASSPGRDSYEARCVAPDSRIIVDGEFY